jgi:hypothetical protein
MISVAQQSVCLAPCPVRAVASLNGRLIEYPEKDEFRRDDCALRRILVAFVYVREGEPPKPDAAQPESIEINNALARVLAARYDGAANMSAGVSMRVAASAENLRLAANRWVTPSSNQLVSDSTRQRSAHA